MSFLLHIRQMCSPFKQIWLLINVIFACRSVIFFANHSDVSFLCFTLSFMLCKLLFCAICTQKSVIHALLIRFSSCGIKKYTNVCIVKLNNINDQLHCISVAFFDIFLQTTVIQSLSTNPFNKSNIYMFDNSFIFELKHKWCFWNNKCM